MAASETTPKFRLQLDNSCHQPKTGKHICRSCWSVADDDAKERLKEFEDVCCAFKTCFHWAADGSTFCPDHTNVRVTGATVSEIYS